MDKKLFWQNINKPRGYGVLAFHVLVGFTLTQTSDKGIWGWRNPLFFIPLIPLSGFLFTESLLIGGTG